MPTPEYIGRYRIERELGRGGMGVVYSGYDDQLERPVAIKIIAAEQADENQRKRFLREARAAARIRHPNVCHLYEISEDADEPFIAMELLEASRWPRAWVGDPWGSRRPSRLRRRCSRR